MCIFHFLKLEFLVFGMFMRFVYFFFFTAWPEEEEACVSTLISGIGFVGQRLIIVKTRVCDDFDGVVFPFHPLVD